ncbi:MAG: hypothetical protein R2755_10850 [Acidimicrobiales bacterium]
MLWITSMAADISSVMVVTMLPTSAAAVVVSLARSFTSVATTANPRPASPARAASMVALRASRLVCSAMAVITDSICEIRPEVSPSRSTVAVAAPAASAAISISDDASTVMRAISEMLPDSSPTAAAVTCMLSLARAVCWVSAAVSASSWPARAALCSASSRAWRACSRLAATTVRRSVAKLCQTNMITRVSATTNTAWARVMAIGCSRPAA